jgi:hypothetical protein
VVVDGAEEIEADHTMVVAAESGDEDGCDFVEYVGEWGAFHTSYFASRDAACISRCFITFSTLLQRWGKSSRGMNNLWTSGGCSHCLLQSLSSAADDSELFHIFKTPFATLDVALSSSFPYYNSLLRCINIHLMQSIIDFVSPSRLMALLTALLYDY